MLPAMRTRWIEIYQQYQKDEQSLDIGEVTGPITAVEKELNAIMKDSFELMEIAVPMGK